ncbi:hypothetical protein HU200_022157 [Digitaria exilis]|uniref:Exostosin GT47 domain-containing protein n=1 Tax=Digitaria exilis TaxID=1010633 RepID=A0A835C3J2_9POAL|nr:hypothetical protein HU200_022157 [Digitaria exilis]
MHSVDVRGGRAGVGRLLRRPAPALCPTQTHRLSHAFELELELARHSHSQPDTGTQPASSAMSKSSAISRPCFFIVAAAALWVLTLYLRLLALMSMPGAAFTGRAASPVPANNDSGDPCRGRYVYIHDLPPRFNADILRGCAAANDRWSDMCQDVGNAGLGRPLSGGALTGATGWYATHQFALDAIFHGRMRQYGCLTNDSSSASAVFVPFYAGFEFATHVWGYDNGARDAAALDLVRWLVRRPEWRRAGGRDHFLVAGRTGWDFRRDAYPNATWGTNLFLLPAVKNMTFLVVETATMGWGNDMAVPYPTYFHPRSDSEVEDWQHRIRNADRWWLMSFVGAARPDDRKSIRSQVMDQQLGCASGTAQCHYPGDIMVLFQSSTFCLQPPGDSASRRSTFDAMVAGCIPVFFQPRSAYLQYRWHLPKDHATYSVFIPAESVRSGNVSVEAELRKIPPAAIAKMREEVIKLVPRLLYADPRYKLDKVKDAFDVAIDGVLERVTEPAERQIGSYWRGSSSRQRFCREPALGKADSAKFFSAKLPLPRAFCRDHGKAFAVCTGALSATKSLAQIASLAIPLPRGSGRGSAFHAPRPARASNTGTSDPSLANQLRAAPLTCQCQCQCSGPARLPVAPPPSSPPRGGTRQSTLRHEAAQRGRAAGVQQMVEAEDKMEKYDKGRGRCSRLCFLLALAATVTILARHGYDARLSNAGVVRIEAVHGPPPPPSVHREPKKIVPIARRESSVSDHSPSAPIDDAGEAASWKKPPSPALESAHSDSDSGSKASSSKEKGSLSASHGNKYGDRPFARALAAADNKDDLCGGQYIYVQELPARFNKEMVQNCDKLSPFTNMCRYTTNGGFGPMLPSGKGMTGGTGWYDTDEHALDIIFHERIRRYECLTDDPSLASAVFVPFYAGLDVARHLWGSNVTARDELALDLARLLAARPEWRAMGGRDHFFVAGRTTWDFRREGDGQSEWGSKLLNLPVAKNMTALVFEASPWHLNDVAVPYPTAFHPGSDEELFLWQDRVRALERPYLFAFAGMARPGDAKSIEGHLVGQCKASPACSLMECSSTTTGSDRNKCESPAAVMRLFQSSTFCLMPRGSTDTRRLAFDAVLAGCIPVFFHPASAYVQYSWHLPKDHAGYSVYIPEEEVRSKNGSVVEERLLKIPPEMVVAMRDAVVGLIPSVTYSDATTRLETTVNDAFDIAVAAVIDKVTKLRRGIVEGRPEEEKLGRYSWKYPLLGEGQKAEDPHEWDPLSTVIPRTRFLMVVSAVLWALALCIRVIVPNPHRKGAPSYGPGRRPTRLLAVAMILIHDLPSRAGSGQLHCATGSSQCRRPRDIMAQFRSSGGLVHAAPWSPGAPPCSSPISAGTSRATAIRNTRCSYRVKDAFNIALEGVSWRRFTKTLGTLWAQAFCLAWRRRLSDSRPGRLQGFFQAAVLTAEDMYNSVYGCCTLLLVLDLIFFGLFLQSGCHRCYDNELDLGGIPTRAGRTFPRTQLIRAPVVSTHHVHELGSYEPGDDAQAHPDCMCTGNYDPFYVPVTNGNHKTSTAAADWLAVAASPVARARAVRRPHLPSVQNALVPVRWIGSFCGPSLAELQRSRAVRRSIANKTTDGYCPSPPMKPTTLGPQKDAADKADAAAAGGVPWPSWVCYLIVLATAFWAVASILFPSSPFSSLPLMPSVTVIHHPPSSHEHPSPPALAGQARAQSSEKDPCAGRYIYVYDLPPRFNDDIVRDCSKLRPWMDTCPYVSNCGMGRPLGDDAFFPGHAWYGTDQFMLDVIFRCRMRRYECLTDDPDLAAAVFVPVYASQDGGRHHPNTTATRDALALDLVAWLSRRPEWRAMGGRDHFLAAGRTAWDFLRMTDDDDDWGTKLLHLPAVRNMTALVLEINPWNQSTTLAVPYPSYFHPATGADVAAWQEKVRHAERTWLFSFAGAPRPATKETVRAQIFRQCGASRRCGMFRCTNASDCEAASSPGAVMRLFGNSSFCLQPRGDTATRKSTFDAVLAGCVPVFFHPDSAYTQYTAFLPPDPESWSVLIMHTDVTGRNVSIEETLSKIPPETVEAMREEVIRLIPRLVYADPRSRRVGFKDAFDIAVDVVLDRVAKRRRGDAGEGR